MTSLMYLPTLTSWIPWPSLCRKHKALSHEANTTSQRTAADTTAAGIHLYVLNYVMWDGFCSIKQAQPSANIHMHSAHQVEYKRGKHGSAGTCIRTLKTGTGRSTACTESKEDVGRAKGWWWAKVEQLPVVNLTALTEQKISWCPAKQL